MVQDFLFRAVHWILFPVLLILFVTESLFVSKIDDYLDSISINLLVILLQGLILIAFYKLKGTQFINFIKDRIGLGDLFFVLAMAFAFSWSTFLFYYIAGLLFTLITWLAVRNLIRLKSQLVPLAGMLALFMTLIMLAEIILPDYSRCMEILNPY
jgi:hypothetical protein